MFGASRKKFVEGVESDYHDDSMYYSQSSIFPPHRSEKDGHFAHESQEYDEPLPGRAGNRHARTDKQYKQFRVRQSKQKLAQHNMYAKATTLSAALYHKQNLNSSGKTASSTDGPKFPGDKGSTVQNNNQQKKGIQVLPDGRVTNIPSGMVTDQFGMIGLLTFIRAAETDPGMVHLALGSDLTTLGLNLNSPEPFIRNNNDCNLKFTYILYRTVRQLSLIVTVLKRHLRFAGLCCADIARQYQKASPTSD
ncbi:CCR4-NOT transcription complex subunit 2 [Acipenser ruthenus]|uniref:CCR4-NOT transcription complex subunit 2 n=1 Tax=Acipenser ruthenus TaxID=7906 RepID=A0A444TWC1_ACIRT|nr:CCR4-NOT transcription complex subunit 2 [Acipenser ruthenus]